MSNGHFVYEIARIVDAEIRLRALQTVNIVELEMNCDISIPVVINTFSCVAQMFVDLYSISCGPD